MDKDQEKQKSNSDADSIKITKREEIHIPIRDIGDIIEKGNNSFPTFRNPPPPPPKKDSDNK